jgi:hypothetical protein
MMIWARMVLSVLTGVWIAATIQWVLPYPVSLVVILAAAIVATVWMTFTLRRQRLALEALIEELDGLTAELLAELAELEDARE